MLAPDIHDRKKYPDMAHWFSPRLLSKLLFNVILSDLFGQYADRRLMIAALDTVPTDKHLERADITNKLGKDAEGATWIDFVADLGDGFDSTYAIALLLAKETLTVDGVTLPRGQILIMGGDEVYPAATADAYRHQLGDPFAFALPDHDRHSDDGIPVYAVPGNHDWYDGLVTFLAFFCRDKHWHMGGWRSQQRRSYFALKLTDTWWLWCTDIQLADNMDQPQADYFKTIAAGMPRGSRIILCSAEPGWLYTDTNRNSFEIVDYAGGIAKAARRNLSIPILLSGDTHHYSRYATEDGLQFITSGGGGAFLHPTHQLKDEIKLKWLGEPKTLSLRKEPGNGHPTVAAACYPTRERSRALLWRNLRFTVTNWDFAILMGVIYWLFAVAIELRPEWDMYIITFVTFAGALSAYTRYQEKSNRPAVYITGILHGLAHACAAILLANCFIGYNAAHFAPIGAWYGVWVRLFRLLVEVGISGAVVGAFLFGLNLLVTCRWFDMNHNDAFSALRLNTYRNFLRIRIKDNEAEIYAIGLDKIPSRHEWQPNPRAASGNPGEPLFRPTQALQPRLIEKRPIIVRT